MDTAILDDLLGRIEKAGSEWTSGERDLAKRVGARYAELVAKQAVGQDVEFDLALTKAAASNLAVAVRQQLQTTILEWAQGFLAGLAKRALGLG